MGADVGALVALDAVVHVPLGDEGGYTALLVVSRALHPGAVLNALEGRYGQLVAVLSVDGAYHFVDEGRVVVRSARIVGQVGPSGIYGELLVLASTIDGGVVLIHHVLTLAAVRLDNELLHLLHGQINGDDTRDAEEGRLEDGVRAVAKADLLGDLGGVHVVDRDVVLGEVLLHLHGQVAHQIVALPDGIEQEGAVLAETAGHVVHVQIGLHVARYEVGRVHQIGRADRVIAEAEVRAGEAARLLGVVREVGLAILIGVVADDLHRVLVGTHRTVGAEAVELGFEHAFSTERDLFLHRQRGEGDVVHDADREVVLGLVEGEVFEDGNDLRRRRVLRAEAVTSTDDDRGILAAIEAVLDVEVERLAIGARFLRTVEHGDALNRLRHCGQEVLSRERTIEVYGYHADLLAVGYEVIDGLTRSFRYGTHSDDDAVCIFGAVVIEEAVFATGELVDLFHVFLHDGGHFVVEAIASLAVLEEVVGVLSHTARHGVHRVQGAGAELGQGLLIDERSEILVVELLDLLNLVRGAEAVEEADERDA